jgi:hypothetical protein
LINVFRRKTYLATNTLERRYDVVIMGAADTVWRPLTTLQSATEFAALRCWSGCTLAPVEPVATPLLCAQTIRPRNRLLSTTQALSSIKTSLASWTAICYSHHEGCFRSRIRRTSCEFNGNEPI